jgi:hypothetical protein
MHAWFERLQYRRYRMHEWFHITLDYGVMCNTTKRFWAFGITLFHHEHLLLWRDF